VTDQFCVPGSTTCSAGTLRTCNAAGSAQSPAVACQDGNPCTVATCSGNACAFVGNRGLACNVPSQFGPGICDASGQCCADDDSACFRICTTNADCTDPSRSVCAGGLCQGTGGID
jgi:hypothetical protein